MRTDLGGLHFNVLTVLALAGAYLATGSGVLLLTALVLQLQMLQQLIPVVRFDGYYVLSDLAGVPDLFARVGPVLRSLRPGHPVDPRVTELRPRSRRFVTGWVVVVVPLLVGRDGAGPSGTSRSSSSAVATGVRLQQLVFDVAWQRRDWRAMALAVVSIALLLLPILGALLAFWRLGATLVLLARGSPRVAGPDGDDRGRVAPPRPAGRGLGGRLHRRGDVRRPGPGAVAGMARRRLPRQRAPAQPGAEPARAAAPRAGATGCARRSRARVGWW